MLMSRITSLLKTAISNKEKAQIKQKVNYDKHRSDIQFELNDLVLIKSHALSKSVIRYSQSLEDRYIGLYVIIKKISSNVYEIVKPITLQSKGTVNVSEMRLYIPSDKPAGWPIADVDDNNEETLTTPSQTSIVTSSDKKSATPQHTDDNKNTVPVQSVTKGGNSQKTVANDKSNKIIVPLPKKRGRPPKNVSKPNKDNGISSGSNVSHLLPCLRFFVGFRLSLNNSASFGATELKQAPFEAHGPGASNHANLIVVGLTVREIPPFWQRTALLEFVEYYMHQNRKNERNPMVFVASRLD
uniref:Uncharacterized protein n=1 Tax=Strigamia maritima TaxID=126957 RepID=T1IRG2_STRMM